MNCFLFWSTLIVMMMTTGSYGQTTANTDICSKDRDCMNGGSCKEGDGNSTHNFCQCPDDYIGMTCELKCPCLHGGTCSSWMEGNITCACPDGFTGHRCETSFVLCPDNAVQCLNGGTCTMADEATETYGCKCPELFSGYNCEYDHRRSPHPNILAEIQHIEKDMAERMSTQAIFGVVIAACFGVLLVIYAMRALQRRTRTRLEWDAIRRNTNLAFDPTTVSRHDLDVL